MDIVDKGSTAGPGMPYSADMNAPVALSNIACCELPAILATIKDWPRGLDTSDLARLGLRAMTLADLGFRSLARAGLLSEPLLIDAFVLPLAAPCAGLIYCVALPALLQRHPFMQGLVNATEMGGDTAERSPKQWVNQGRGLEGCAFASSVSKTSPSRHALGG